MKGVLVIGGLAPERDKILKIIATADITAAADSGFDTLFSIGLLPDFVVGDMDSILSRGNLNKMPEGSVHIYPEDKDQTDTEIGIEHLKGRGCTSVILVGGGEGRLAHTLGLISLFEGENFPEAMYTRREEIRRIEGKYQFSAQPGELISLFPLGKTGKMYSEGLKWPLAKLNWNRGDVGLSNVAIDFNIKIEMEEGAMLLIREELKNE